VTGTVAEIPASVDLSEGTLATSANGEVALPATASIKTISVGHDLTIAGAATEFKVDTLVGSAGSVALPAASAITTLSISDDFKVSGTALGTITTITATAASKTLTLPDIAVTVTTIDTGTVGFSIAGTTSTGATIKPTTISGVGGLTLGNNVVLAPDGSKDITINTGSKVVASGIAQLGAAGVNLPKIKGDGTLELTESTVDFVASLLPIGVGLKLTGAPTFSADATITKPFSASGNRTIGSGVTLTVTSPGEVTGSSSGLVKLGPGTYKATGGTAVISDAAITLATANSKLELGTGGLSLTATGASGIFTPTAKVVTLNGTGNGSITVPGAGTLTVGATAELALGDGAVLLGFDSTGGILTTAAGAKISGFERSATLKTSGTTLAESGDKLGDYNSGVVFTYANTALGSKILTTTTAESDLFKGATDKGGAVTKNSSITPTT
jgi:hypothetical protein